MTSAGAGQGLMFESMQVRCLLGTRWVQDRATDFKRNGWFLRDPCGIFCAMYVSVCTFNKFHSSHSALDLPEHRMANNFPLDNPPYLYTLSPQHNAHSDGVRAVRYDCADTAPVLAREPSTCYLCDSHICVPIYPGGAGASTLHADKPR